MEDNQTISTKKVAVTIALPNAQGIVQLITDKMSILLSKVSALAYSVYNPLRKSRTSSNSDSGRFGIPKFSFNKFNFNKKNAMKIGFPLLIGVVAIVGLVSLVRGLPNAQSNSAAAGESNIELPNAVSTIELNRNFEFPLRDDEGEEVGRFDFIVENAELQKQIIVQGKRATAVNGRIFLVFNLKIVNDLKFPMELPTRNFMRIILNNNDAELLAPDIHNDPVEVQAISTKYTRLGLAIDESAAKQTIRVQVGEVDGEKQTIELNFK